MKNLSEKEKQRRKEWGEKMAEARKLKKIGIEEKKEVPDLPADKKVCNRCGYEYKESEIVIREQQKCCPNCLCPIEWKS